jgi:DNA mismatch endonuclease, patch repair protein
MIDIVDKQTRSRMMSNIRGKNTSPEIKVRRFLHARGLRYRLHVKTLPGKPDLVFPKYHSVVFVHGCFWHRHRGCKYAYTPKSNQEFWNKKFEENILRDKKAIRTLKMDGWRVFVIWECEVNEPKMDSLYHDIMRET